MADGESWRNVGARIRQVRKENHLTLKQLALGCDMSANAISLVERGEVAPTVMTVCKIAHALGVSASSLFYEICSSDITLTRAADAQTHPLAEAAAYMQAGKRAASGRSPQQTNPCSLTQSIRQTLVCICGPIQCEVDDQSYTLAPGDCLTFDARAFYRWKNLSAGTGVAVIVQSSEYSPDPCC